MGDVQWLPGYCVLLTDDPDVQQLSELPHPTRMQYLESLDRLAEAVESTSRHGATPISSFTLTSGPVTAGNLRR